MTKQEALEAVTGQRIDLAEPWGVPNVGAEGPRRRRKTMSNTPKNPADAGPDLQRRVSPQCWGPGQFVVVATFRYCLGRQTYIVQECADWLTLHWPVIEQPVRNLIQRELEAAFVKDDAIRAAAGPGTGYKPLGWDCDRREWERVRSQWANVRGEAPQPAPRKDEDA